MICKNCGAELRKGETFCGVCGEKIQFDDNIECSKCAGHFDPNLGICPFCGNEVSDSTITEKTDDSETENSFITGIKIRKKVPFIMAVAILLSFLCSFLIILYLWISPIFSSDARKYSSAEIYEICDILDYSALAATADYYCDEINDTYVFDADGDGKKELFMSTYNELYYQKPNILAFDTLDIGIMASAVHNGAAGSASITTEINDKLCLEWGYYSVGNFNIHYEEWTNDGWNEITDSIDFEEGEDSDWAEQVAQNAYESYLPKVTQKTSHHKILSNFYDAKNYKEIIDAYKGHISKWWGENYKYIEEDIDGDGKDEYAFIISDFGKHWLDNLTTVGTDAFQIENFVNSLGDMGTTVIYADADKNGIVFHTFFSDITVDVYTDDNRYEGDEITLSWQNGELLIKCIKEKNIKTDIFFCSEVILSKESYELDENAFNDISELYTKYLKKHLYKDVLVKYVDICDAPGDELVCVCTNSNIDRINAYAIYCGRIITLYEQDYGQTGAVYLSENGDKMMLLNYIQRECKNQNSSSGISNIRRGNDYRYWFTGFDDNYCAYEQDMQYLLLYDDETPTAEDNEFFAKLNEFLDVATVCVDSYELTGYSVIPNIQTDYFETETGKYLSISNCNLNKKGKVSVNQDSWLNFRKGPNIAYDKILIDSANNDSFVKQMNGSSVTVIDTKNTDDAENPIWVKIQIKYSDNTLVGYSSQRFIEIAEIKHIAVGETFTVEASTNDDGLYWSSNDENVLSVDSSTGKVTGNNKGLVLVSVESESGLTDSCLIMVD